MNHRCHLVLTENGHQFQNTSSMEIKRRYKRCNEEKKEMAVSIPTSTINQVTMLAIFYIMLIVHIIIITRPKPAYGRQGLARLWGQDTDQAGTFWGFVD